MISALLIVIAVVFFLALAKDARVVRREALLEGAAAIRSRAATKWERDPNAAIEAGNCAAVLERMAGAAPSAPALQEQAA